MSNEYPTGSEWRKWDLHIHSPLTLLSNQYPKTNGSPDWDAFLGRLESGDFAVVGVTDYFTIDGYKRLKAFKASGRLGNVRTLLPNVEFRLNSVISSKKDGDEPRRLNFHVIFSDEVADQDIEEHFLHDLHFYYEGNPQDKDEKRKLKVSNIEELGARLIQEHKGFQDGRSALEIGAMNTVVSHEEITSILQSDSRFRGKYLIVFPEELSNLISWDGQDHHIRKSILQKSDMVFSSSPKTRAWCLGLDPYKEGPEAYVKEFKTLKPCIHGSDAHRLERIGVPCARRGQPGHDCQAAPQECDLRHCWVKADPTFEGLKQVLYEPAERVVVQGPDPTPVKSNHCIDKIEVAAARINDELSIAGTALPVNSGLVAVTGGKGSGKTALVDLLANCYMDRRNSGDPNSFVRRIMLDNPDVAVSLGFKDGSVFGKSVKDAKVFQAGELVYIAQGELEEYIGDSSDLETYIRELIFQSPQVKNSVKAFEFEGLAGEIAEIQRELMSRHGLIEKLEIETSESAAESVRVEHKRAEAALKDVETQLKDLETRLSTEKLEITREKQQVMAGLQQQKEQALGLRTLLVNAERFVNESLPQFRRDIGEINKLLKALGVQPAVTDLTYEDAGKLASLRSTVDAVLRDVIERIEAAEKEVKKFEAGMQEHAKQLNRKSELQGQLERVAARLKEVEEGAERLQQLRSERQKLFTRLLGTILQQQKKYAELIGVFASEKTGVLSDLDFVAELKFASVSLLDGAQDVLDNRQVEVVASERGKSVFEQLLALYTRVIGGESDKVEEVVMETDRLAEMLRQKVKKSQAISAGNLYRCLYGTYVTAAPVVTYKKTRLSKLSLGQKATVLMKIYLAQGTSPIIIDSHDDHLDNEFIMEELVGAIRQAKCYRQVILASNNGNVVINSDAEQIIVAGRQGGEIFYSSGSIEDPVIRERALKVLEGGDVAFKKRQQKYRIGV